MTPQTVLDFWFAEENRPFWFAKSDEFDETIRRRFGRYPHRNAVLGRDSTAEELEFLQQEGSSF